MALKKKPLRTPGQSLDEEIDRLLNDKFLGYWMFTSALWFIAAVEYFENLAHSPRLPGYYAAAAAIATIVVAIQFVRLRAQLRNLRAGRDGERVVAEILGELARSDAKVLHDIPAKGFNVDHVVVCNRGIFVIETKNWTKPTKASKLAYDGVQIFLDGSASAFQPIGQCEAQTKWIRDLLKESTGKSLPVRGVVVFPEWYVTTLEGAKGADIWVLNPKALRAWIENESVRIDSSDAAMAAFHLQQYVLSFRG